MDLLAYMNSLSPHDEAKLVRDATTKELEDGEVCRRDEMFAGLGG